MIDQHSGGFLLFDKPIGKSSFHFVHLLRKKSGIQKVGHAGTLDPFASGLLILLVGKNWTRQQDRFMQGEKEYLATIRLGIATDSYDCTGITTHTSDYIPSLEEVTRMLVEFQGVCEQIPPMYSAKKIAGKRLYELARLGVEVARAPIQVELKTTLIAYNYPNIDIRVVCSKGTYIRSIGNDMGNKLHSFGHLTALRRVRSGIYHVDDAISYDDFQKATQEEILDALCLNLGAE